MTDVQVRLVRVDDEADAVNRPTRLPPDVYAFQDGGLIAVQVDGRWRLCAIVGQAHSELRVRIVSPGP